MTKTDFQLGELIELPKFVHVAYVWKLFMRVLKIIWNLLFEIWNFPLEV